MRILLAIDGSEQSEAAVDETVRQHVPADSQVHVVSVVDLPTFPIAVPWAGVDFYDPSQKIAREFSNAAVKKATAKLRAAKGGSKLRITMDVLAGSPKQVILDEAERFGADLIVVGSHGHGVLDRFLLGSVSQAVVLHAKCSVEIVRRPKKGERAMRILLAIDGSEQSEAAVDEIVRQHVPADSQVHVVSVVEPLYLPEPFLGKGVNMSHYKEIEKTSSDGARVVVEKAAAKIRADMKGRQLGVTTEVLSGSPKQVILEEAERFGADLIFVGSHGYGMVEHFLLGSVSHAVALHAKCSVEIVRSPKTHTSESK